MDAVERFSPDISSLVLDTSNPSEVYVLATNDCYAALSEHVASFDVAGEIAVPVADRLGGRCQLILQATTESKGARFSVVEDGLRIELGSREAVTWLAANLKTFAVSGIGRHYHVEYQGDQSVSQDSVPMVFEVVEATSAGF